MLKNLYEALNMLDDLEGYGPEDDYIRDGVYKLLDNYIATLSVSTLFGLTDQYNDFESVDGIKYTIQKHTDGSISIYPKKAGDFEPITIPTFLERDLIRTVLDSGKTVSLYLKDEVKEIFGLDPYKDYKLVVDSETFETLEVRDTEKPKLKGFQDTFIEGEIEEITFKNHLTLEMFRVA